MNWRTNIVVTATRFSPTVDGLIDNIGDAESTIQFDIDG